MKKIVEKNAQDEDVVVIEQRDKKSYLYIAIAALLGLAAGGLIGGAVASNHWEHSYTQLEKDIDKIGNENKKVLAQAEAKNQQDIEKVKQTYEQQIQSLKDEQATTVSALNNKLERLQKQNEDLEAKISKQQNELHSAESQNKRLNQTADIQASVFERSRELFQKELTVKQQLEQLNKEQIELKNKIQVFKKECDAYLEGTSWDAHSDACDKQDAANSRMSQINQLIKVHQMDLKQINTLTKKLGLD